MKIALAELASWCGGTVHPPGAESLMIAGISTDSRSIKPGELYVAIRGLKMDGHRFIRHAAVSGAVAAVVDKQGSHPDDFPVIIVHNTLEALGRMAHGYRWLPPLIPWVAVTGSNGKTTTRELVSLMLQTRWKVRTSSRNWNNFVGLPLSMMGPPDDAGAAVMEMGTNHPGEIAKLREITVPTVGVITGIGASHLEGFGSVAAVAREKADIFGWLPPDGLAVYPADAPNVDILRSTIHHAGASFSLSGAKADLMASDIRLTSAGSEFLANGVKVRLPLLGKHNVSNCLAAMLAARHLGVGFADSAQAVTRAKPVQGRLQVMETAGGLNVLNDTYNANPDSTIAALEVLMDVPGGRKIAVIGDMLELGRDSRALHREIGLTAGMMGLDGLFATGTESVVLAEAAQANAHIMVRHFQSVDALWTSLRNYVKPGDWILVKGSRGMLMERVVNELMDWRRS